MRYQARRESAVDVLVGRGAPDRGDRLDYQLPRTTAGLFKLDANGSLSAPLSKRLISVAEGVVS